MFSDQKVLSKNVLRAICSPGEQSRRTFIAWSAVSLSGLLFCQEPGIQAPPRAAGSVPLDKNNQKVYEDELKHPPPPPQPVPRMQLIPLPDFQASFQRDGAEVARYWYSPSLHRPFIFPVIGPSGRSVTRMGSPHEPQSHSHHNSVWIGHNDVNGTDFWTDSVDTGRIIHQTVEQFTDGENAATCSTVNAWTTKSSAVLLTEGRLITLKTLANDELMISIDLILEPRDASVTFGKTPYGLVGVRMAKTIGVSDGGGTIRNSEGDVDEPNVFWKQAKWVDYAGPITNKAEEGITLMDHPENPNYPTFFHVRRDGWMGSCLTLDAARTVAREKPLRLRYGLYVHNGIPPLKVIEECWGEFARESMPDLVLKHK